MFKPVEVKAKANYRLWVKFSDGVQGEADLSHLVGKGVFSVWNDHRVFEKVHIGDQGEFMWENDVDLCPDSIYMQISGKTPEQVFPGLHRSA